MTTVDGAAIVGLGLPAEDGRKLAHAVLDMVGRELDVVIDVREVRAGKLISSFFVAFLQAVVDRAPERLDAARAIRWQTRHAFQAQNIECWMREFSPDSDAGRHAERM